MNRGRSRDSVTGALLFLVNNKGVMHFEAWSSNMYFNSQKQSQMIFFGFLFPNFKIAIPGIMISVGHSQQLYQSAILGHQN